MARTTQTKMEKTTPISAQITSKMRREVAAHLSRIFEQEGRKMSTSDYIRSLIIKDLREKGVAL